MISIIMPTYNKPIQLELSLKSFSEQDISKDEYEIVIVDDASDVSIVHIISKFSKIMQLQYKRVSKLGRAGARNVGIDIAKGDIIIFSDDDTLVLPDFVRRHKEIHEKNNNTVVLGKRKKLFITNKSIEKELANWPGSENLAQKSIIRNDSYEVLSRKIFTDHNHACNSDVAWICSITANMSLSRDMLMSIGKFDSDFKGWGVEDIELGYRLCKHKFLFLYFENIVNYHIEHHRDVEKMNKDLIMNMRKFYTKYKDDNIKKYWEFLMGKTTLRQFILETQLSAIPNIDRIPDERIRFFSGKYEDI